MPCLLPATRCALTAPFHPYPAELPAGRYIFCCTFRRLAPPRDYLAPCPCGARTFLYHNRLDSGYDSDCPADSRVHISPESAAAPPAAHPAMTFRTFCAIAGLCIHRPVAPDQRRAIEIKRGLTQPKPSAGFHIGSEDIEAEPRLVIYPGNHSFIQGDNVETVPLRVLMEELSGLDD